MDAVCFRWRQIDIVSAPREGRSVGEAVDTGPTGFSGKLEDQDSRETGLAQFPGGAESGDATPDHDAVVGRGGRRWKIGWVEISAQEVARHGRVGEAGRNVELAHPETRIAAGGKPGPIRLREHPQPPPA